MHSLLRWHCRSLVALTSFPAILLIRTNAQLSVSWLKVNPRYLRSAGNCKQSFHPGVLWPAHVTYLQHEGSASSFQSTTFTCDIFNLNKSDRVERKMPHSKYLTKASKAISCCVKISSNIVKCFYRQVICCEVGGAYLPSTKRSCAVNCVCSGINVSYMWHYIKSYLLFWKVITLIYRISVYCILVTNCINCIDFS